MTTISSSIVAAAAISVVDIPMMPLGHAQIELSPLIAPHCLKTATR
jgi:hypothetical protein